MVPPPSHDTMGLCNQITLLIFHFISSTVVTLLEIINVPIQASDIFYHTVSFKFINFNFQIFLLFVPEKPACFTSYVVLGYPRYFGSDPVTAAF